MNLQIIILCCIQQDYKNWKMTILYKKKHDNYEKYIKIKNERDLAKKRLYERQQKEEEKAGEQR